MKVPWWKVFSAALLGAGVATINSGHVSLGVLITIIAYDWMTTK